LSIGQHLRLFAVCMSAASCSIGCLQSLGASSTIVASRGGRSMLVEGFAMRTDIRLPRTYAWYAGTELVAGSQVLTADKPSDASSVGHGIPTERLSLNFGRVYLPSGEERFGLRAGVHTSMWHALLGDSRSRFAWTPLGMDVSPLISLDRKRPSWESDETVQLNVLLVPTFALDPVVRINSATQPTFALAPTVTLSIVVNASSAVLP